MDLVLALPRHAHFAVCVNGTLRALALSGLVALEIVICGPVDEVLRATITPNEAYMTVKEI